MPSWSENVLDGASKRGRRPAVTDAARRGVLTYDRLAVMVSRIASGLVRRGLAPGHEVLVHVTGTRFYPVAVHAAAAAGAVVVPLAKPDLAGTRARMMITDSPAAIAAAADSRLRQVFTFGLDIGATPVVDLLGEPELPLPHGGSLRLGGVTVPGGEWLDGHEPLDEDDTVLLGVTELKKATLVYDLALAAGAHVVAAPGLAPAEWLLLAEEFDVTVAALPPDSSAVFSGLRAPRLVP